MKMMLLALFVFLQGVSQSKEIKEEDYAALLARVNALEESAEPRRNLLEDEMSLDMNDPQTARRLGVASRYSRAFAHRRHEYMTQRVERNAERRRLQSDFYDPDELCWTIDNLWVIVAGLICWFLQGGFGLIETGSLRAKSSKNIMLKNLMDACFGGLIYYTVGWGLAHGGETTNEKGAPDGATFLGDGQFMLLSHRKIESYGYHLWFFNYVFAATIATIVSGAVAERIQFRAYCIYAILLTGFVYPICSHWIWSPDGFLYRAAVVDFAGGGAVHALSGVAAWMGALACGPRDGVFIDGKYAPPKPHDTSMMMLGLFVFWFGFIPFNSGSGLSLCGFASANLTARIVVITTLGGCSGGITSLFWGLLKKGYASLEYAIPGVLAGMIGVCSCCAVVDVWAIFWIISPLSVLAYWGCQGLIEKCGIDDPLTAGALHFGPGIVGMLAVGFFATPRFMSDVYLAGYDTSRNRCADLDGYTEVPDGDENIDGDFIFYKHRKNDGCIDFYGVFFGGSGKQLAWQLAASIIYTVWGVAACWLIFFPMKYLGILRAPIADERQGLDVTHHGGTAYEWMDPPAPTDAKAVELETFRTDDPDDV